MQASDADVRRRALDIRRSFLVQAPAGSGKTELLTQRFLALLAIVEHPEAIVAITFTRKAAGEMRSRISAALSKAAEEPEPEVAHEQATWRLARAAWDRDQSQGWQLSENPGRLRILTMDALAASLAGQMPWLSRMGGLPTLASRPEDLHKEAALRTLGLLETFDLFAPMLERLLLHLDNNHARACDLLMAMLGNRDQWLRHVAGTPRREDLERALHNTIGRVLIRLHPLLPPAAVDLMRHAARTAPEYAIATPLSSDPSSIDTWRTLASFLLTASGNPRRSVNVRSGFPPGDPRKPEMERLLRNLDPSFAELLWEAAQLPPARYSDEQWDIIATLFELLKVSTAQLHLLFQERRQSDFIELSLSALQALGSDETPSPLAFSLDYRLEHLLVDEFQDTSITKLRLLERLTSEWMPEDGRTVFAVGDPMQSIYGFQEADVSLFERCRRHGLGRLPLEPLTLRANFRAFRNLVDWCNGAFPRILAAIDDPESGAVAYSRSEAQRDALPGASVQVHAIPVNAITAEACRVADLVEQTGGSVAILVRKRPDAAAILRELRARGIAYQAVDMDTLAERSVIQDLRALTRALLHPADRTSWLAVLRAPFCGLTLAELLALGPGILLDSLDRNARLRRAAPILRNAVLNRRRLPLRRLVRDTWIALGGPACLAHASDAKDAETYFDLLDTMDAAGDLSDLSALDHALARLAASPDPEADGRVQVMTMHKAKGLEFDTVILPGLGSRDRTGSSSLLKWRETNQGADLIIGCIRETGSASDPVYDFLQRIERQKEAHESGRLLYVACTRARRQLHLVGWTGPNGEPVRGTFLERLWPVIQDEFRARSAALPAPVPAVATLRRLRRVIDGWSPPPPPAPMAWEHPSEERTTLGTVRFDWSGETLRAVGIGVHAALLQLARNPDLTGNDVRELLRASLLSSSVPMAELSLALERALSAIHSTRQSERGHWILQQHAEARNEWELSARWNQQIVACKLDRTFVDADGIRWIIDYKTGFHEGAGASAFLDAEVERYREQLERYGEIVSRWDPRPIRLGLYFPLMNAWREWEFTRSTALEEVMGLG
jgi:ATP-dependent exoDNAse (exonuclease V) beta subunit